MTQLKFESKTRTPTGNVKTIKLNQKQTQAIDYIGPTIHYTEGNFIIKK